jgi:hypothetical protein
MLRAGKKTKEWQRVRERLKPRFEAVGIIRCEFRYQGCWHNNALSFAHMRKRRNLAPNELKIVALACIPCHDKLELMPESLMAQTVSDVIQRRVLQPDLTGIE